MCCGCLWVPSVSCAASFHIWPFFALLRQASSFEAASLTRAHSLHARCLSPESQIVAPPVEHDRDRSAALGHNLRWILVQSGGTESSRAIPTHCPSSVASIATRVDPFIDTSLDPNSTICVIECTVWSTISSGSWSILLLRLIQLQAVAVTRRSLVLGEESLN